MKDFTAVILAFLFFCVTFEEVAELSSNLLGNQESLEKCVISCSGSYQAIGPHLDK